jgi:hypothetical protein
MSSNSSSNYAISASGDNFIANVGGNAIGEEVFAPFTVLSSNNDPDPVIATFRQDIINLGRDVTPVYVTGEIGLGRAYDATNNLPTPSADAYNVINTDRTLNGVAGAVPPGTYIISTDIAYGGAGIVLPANALVVLSLIRGATSIVLGGFIVPAAVPGSFGQVSTVIVTIEEGDTFALSSTGGINLGVTGSLNSIAHAFCGDLPPDLAGSVRRSR